MSASGPSGPLVLFCYHLAEDEMADYYTVKCARVKPV